MYIVVRHSKSVSVSIK